MIYMKRIITLLLCINCYVLYSQTPQFAVVRPDGTSFICPSWDSAYNKSLDGDYIYLPGIGISNTVTINKRIYIIGAGHHPDSTIATNPTIINSDLKILKAANGGSIEGIKVTGSVYFGNSALDSRVINYSIKRSIFNIIVFNYTTSSTYNDSLPTNIFLADNIIGDINGQSSSSQNLIRNIFIGQVKDIKSSAFKNNIFLREYPPQIGGPFPMTNVILSTFENNIFLNYDPNSAPGVGLTGNCLNTYRNNLKYLIANWDASIACPPLSQSNNLSVPNISDIFVNYSTQGFSYSNNYHLKPTCPGINAGTDGTDVGIYGTLQPVSEGWLPSNPHIYFKQIAPQTNSNGSLPVQIKVRSNN